MLTGNEGFVEVVDTRTGVVSRVPRDWLDNPVLGRFIERTITQRALDGEIGPAPTSDSTVQEIRDFARDAGIGLGGATKKDDLLAVVHAHVGPGALPAPDVQPTDPTQDPDGTEPTDETPAFEDSE